FQHPFRQLPGVEYFSFELTPDWQVPGEWTFARLMFPPGPNDGYAGRFDGDFRQGLSLWTQDYPRADRHFSQAVRRLTRIQVRSVEQPVMMEDKDEAFNFPWIYAVQVGEWGFTEQEAKVMREYLLRGGFFMADDFHGDYEWEMFMKRIRLVFPDRPIVDIPDSDLVQFRRRRRVGIRRRSTVSGEVFRIGDSRRSRLRGLRHDALESHCRAD